MEMIEMEEKDTVTIVMVTEEEDMVMTATETEEEDMVMTAMETEEDMNITLLQSNPQRFSKYAHTLIQLDPQPQFALVKKVLACL